MQESSAHFDYEREFNVWHQASSFQLLRLLKQLGIEQRSIANFLDVTVSSISMWMTGARPIPAKYHDPLLAYTQRAQFQAIERNQKDISILPEDLQRAAIEEFQARLTQWSLEVLHEKGILQKSIQYDCHRIGAYASKEALTAEDRQWLMSLCKTMQSQLRTLEALEDIQEDPREGQDRSDREQKQ